jgi:hypothetical protein
MIFCMKKGGDPSKEQGSAAHIAHTLKAASLPQAKGAGL